MARSALLKSEHSRHAGSVLQAIVALIEERSLAVGDNLPSIRELAELFEVKPTAVRDALLHAEAKGLVRILPRSRAILLSRCADRSQATPLHEPNLLHLIDARRVVEVELAGRAAARRRLEDLLPARQALEAMLRWTTDSPAEDYVVHDVAFHVAVSRLAGNEVLFAVQRSLMEQMRSHLLDSPRTLPWQKRTNASHAAIYAALVAGDAQAACVAMRDHLSLAYDALINHLKNVPNVEQ